MSDATNPNPATPTGATHPGAPASGGTGGKATTPASKPTVPAAPAAKAPAAPKPRPAAAPATGHRPLVLLAVALIAAVLAVGGIIGAALSFPKMSAAAKDENLVVLMQKADAAERAYATEVNQIRLSVTTKASVDQKPANQATAALTKAGKKVGADALGLPTDETGQLAVKLMSDGQAQLTAARYTAYHGYEQGKPFVDHDKLVAATKDITAAVPAKLKNKDAKKQAAAYITATKDQPVPVNDPNVTAPTQRDKLLSAMTTPVQSHFNSMRVASYGCAIGAIVMIVIAVIVFLLSSPKRRVKGLAPAPAAGGALAAKGAAPKQAAPAAAAHKPAGQAAAAQADAKAQLKAQRAEAKAKDKAAKAALKDKDKAAKAADKAPKAAPAKPAAAKAPTTKAPTATAASAAPAAKPAAHPAAKPVTTSAAKPVTTPAKPVTTSPAKPVTTPAAKPVTPPSAAPAAKPVTQPSFGARPAAPAAKPATLPHTAPAAPAAPAAPTQPHAGGWRPVAHPGGATPSAAPTAPTKPAGAQAAGQTPAKPVTPAKPATPAAGGPKIPWRATGGPAGTDQH